MPKILKKIGWAIFVVLIYFLGIRELRQEVHDVYMGTLFPDQYGQINEDYFFYSQSSVSFTIIPNDVPLSKGWQFRVPFDSYWLFGTFALVLIGVTKKEYFILAVIHLTSGVFNLMFVAIGLQGFDVLLILTDFICRYLIPLFSLGYVALIVGSQKKMLSTHD